MSRLLSSLVITICLVALAPSIQAHPGHDHDHDMPPKGLRTWTDAEGIFRLEAWFVSAKDDTVRLRRKDNTLVELLIQRLSKADREWIEKRIEEIRKLNREFPIQAEPRKPGDQDPPKAAPEISKSFQPFADKVRLRWDDEYLYVESNGIPDHQMMVGITAWQQQVPLPQPYTGANAWRIPLYPVPAKKPLSAKTGFFRGAIALAVNGVPIFNPIKNDGRTDTLLAGELDEFGGHCGRADDYHYHIAPVHLEKEVGKGKPIAYALDGYPIYGFDEADGSKVKGLDWLNGHKDAQGNYHYHATKTYPYLNGGFYGEVTERDGELHPQPRAQGVRPSLRGLRGAKITGFTSPKPDAFRLEYDLRGEKYSVNYTIAKDGSVAFRFVSPSGTESETYKPRVRGRGQGEPRNEPPDSRPNPSQNDNRRNSDANGRPRGGGNLLERALDADGNRTISAEELRKAAAAIRALDRNGDGNVTRDELRPPNQQGGQQGRPNGRGGPQGTTGPRQPWILVHAKEIDANEDGIISRDEIVGEATRSFVNYDRNKDGKLTEEEYAGRGGNVRSAMGGFIRGHAKELDRDEDGVLTKEEVVGNAERMFGRIDRDKDDKITKDELEGSRRTEDDRRGRQGGDRPMNEQPKPTRSDSNRFQTKRPNFVFILIDDMGWNAMGFSGNSFVETPHADKLASEGIAFTRAYASAPNCAPTRACLLSGQYTPRHGVFTVVDERHAPGQPHHRILASTSRASMSGDVVTIAEALGANGYRTAAFGMWNLGRGRRGPSTATGQGFDVYKKPQDLGFDRNAYRDRTGKYLTDALFDEGIQFIEQNRERPFFLYLPTHAIHAPYDPKPELLAKYRRKAEKQRDKNLDPVYAASIEAVDQNIGRLLASLEKHGLAENTMVIFTSDNGGTPRYVAPLRGSKGSLYEGGLRVPAFVWWSGIAKPGRSCAQPISSIDFYPTMLEAARIPTPKNHALDGASLLPILKGADKIERDSLFWHFPCYIGRSSPSSAILQGQYKLIEFFEDEHVELYNLKDDERESKDLSKRMPAKAKELREALIRWRKSVQAPVPRTPNPDFDPKARSGGRRGGKQRNRNQ